MSSNLVKVNTIIKLFVIYVWKIGSNVMYYKAFTN